MRAEVQDKSFAQQLCLHLPMKQCESTGGRALPCPASSWKKSHTHLLFPQTSHGWSRSACPDSCYSARHSLSSPPAFSWDWVGDASPWNQYWVWINPPRQFGQWGVKCRPAMRDIRLLMKVFFLVSWPNPALVSWSSASMDQTVLLSVVCCHFSVHE